MYFLRSRGLLPGLAAGTNWVFRDESAHMAFAFEVLRTVRARSRNCSTRQWAASVREMIDERWTANRSSPRTCCRAAWSGMTRSEMRQYLEYVADQRLVMLGLPPLYGAKNPFPFMELQDVQELTNFFERRVSAYQVAVQGEVAFDQAF